MARSARPARNGTEREVKTSAQPSKWMITKSNAPPIAAAAPSTFAWLPPDSPAMSTSVVAVASGNGNSPCISLTK